MAWLVVVLLLLLIVFGMPIGFALMISATISLAISGLDLITAPIQLFSGVNKVVLLAIPLFIFMGELMRPVQPSGSSSHRQFRWCSMG